MEMLDLRPRFARTNRCSERGKRSSNSDPELPAVVADSGHFGWSHRDAETWLRQSRHRIFDRLWQRQLYSSIRKRTVYVPVGVLLAPRDAPRYHTRRRHSRGSSATVSPLISRRQRWNSAHSRRSSSRPPA